MVLIHKNTPVTIGSIALDIVWIMIYFGFFSLKEMKIIVHTNLFNSHELKFSKETIQLCHIIVLKCYMNPSQ